MKRTFVWAVVMKKLNEKNIRFEIASLVFANACDAAGAFDAVSFEDGVLHISDRDNPLRALPRQLGAAAQTLRVKATPTSFELEIKFADKLRALDLADRLLTDRSSDGGDTGTFTVNYDYISPRGGEPGGAEDGA